ncbi:helix-turn-helix transcriptional regulator [Candidatus Dojkabacteria bacterium]|nr:helix-turn-helix transcriptional regulator [Candidatus Dojkabacteria bacterium]
MCVCELSEKLGISRNLLSFHLKTLYKAGILDKRRDGNQIFFFIKNKWKKRVSYFFSFVGIN